MKKTERQVREDMQKMEAAAKNINDYVKKMTLIDLNFTFIPEPNRITMHWGRVNLNLAFTFTLLDLEKQIGFEANIKNQIYNSFLKDFPMVLKKEYKLPAEQFVAQFSIPHWCSPIDFIKFARDEAPDVTVHFLGTGDKDHQITATAIDCSKFIDLGFALCRFME